MNSDTPHVHVLLSRDRLKRAVAERGTTLSAIASQVGIAKETLTRSFGSRPIAYERAVVIAHLAGLPVDDIIVRCETCGRRSVA